MIGSDGSIIIDTRINSDGFNSGIKGFNSGIKGMNNEIRKLGKTIFSVFGIGLLTKLGKEAIELGSDLQEVQNVVDVTFTTMSDKVNEFAKGAAEAAGLSETMAKKYVGTFGAMAKAFGFAENEAFTMSTALTQLAGDVASFYNITQDEAYTKLKSVFTGETETLKDLGVVMTQSALDSYAMAEGYGKTTKQMSEQEKVALRYSFVLDQLSAAQGDFVRTSDSWANMTRVLSLNFDSLKANIGQALINIFTPFLKVINQIVSKMAELSRHFVAFSELLVGKSTSGGGGSPGDSLGEITEGYEDIADATDAATKAQKNYLSGLDEIRTYTPQQTEGDEGTGEKITVPSIPGKEKEEIKETDGLLSKLEERFPRLIQFLEDVKNKIKEIFEDIKLGDFEELGKDISELAITIFDFISESIDSIDWESIGKKIGEFLKGIKWIDLIKSALKLKYNIWKAIAEVWFGSFQAAPIETAILTAFMALKFTPLGGILSGKIISAITGAGLFGKIKEALALTFGGAGTLSESLTAVFGTVGTIIAGIVTTVGGAVLAVTNFVDMLKNGFSWLNEILMIVGIAIAAVGAVILGAPAAIAAVVAGIVAAVATLVVVIKEHWQEICDFFANGWEWLKTTISNGLGAISTWWSNTWESIKTFFSNIWDSIVDSVKKVINFLETSINNGLTTIKSTWSNIWNGIKTATSNVWNGIKNTITNVITSVKTTISNIVNSIKTVWSNAWNGMKTTVTNIWNGILSSIKGIVNGIIGAINGMISGIVNGINFVINAFNGLNFDIPDWVPIIGGESFGFDIPLLTAPQIPYLASGAVIPPNAPFMAILGDQKRGTNIEAPLSTIESALDNVLNRRGGTSGSITLHNVIQVNRRTLYDEFIEEAKLRMSTTGRNPFDFA